MLPKILIKFKDSHKLVPDTITMFDLAINFDGTETIFSEETGNVLYNCTIGLTEHGRKMFLDYNRMIYKSSKYKGICNIIEKR